MKKLNMKNEKKNSVGNLLEIGCSYGYNLKKFGDLGYKCYGIDPSKQAIEYGHRIYSEINLNIGTADELPYESDMFDVVVLGFCMYQVDRDLIDEVKSEVNRILKCGGFLCITDFDTPYSYINVNHHNENTPTYKMDYSLLFTNDINYTMIEKHSYSSNGNVFTEEIYERISTQILYKEKEQIRQVGTAL